MVENIDSIKPILRKYLELVKEKKIKIDKAYLFGSYLRGNATEDSDIDIAIISRDFLGDRFEDRKLIVPLRRNIDRRIEPIPYRPEDFSIPDPLVIEILNHGIEIK
jgi:predicted nucleotidyltransferase